MPSLKIKIFPGSHHWQGVGGGLGVGLMKFGSQISPLPNFLTLKKI
jgi:hypothetical protein